MEMQDDQIISKFYCDIMFEKYACSNAVYFQFISYRFKFQEVSKLFAEVILGFLKIKTKILSHLKSSGNEQLWYYTFFFF